MSIRTHRRYACLYIHYFLWNLVKSGLPWKFECFQSQFAMKILMFGKTKIWTDSVGKMISVYNILFRQDSFAVISFTHISAKISFHCLVHSPFKGFSTLYETIEKIINRKESYKWFQVGWIDDEIQWDLNGVIVAQCSVCQSIFGYSALPIMDDLIMYLFAAAFHCDKCGKGYRVKRSLWRHQKYECDNESQYPCLVKSCPLKYKRKYSLVAHLRNAHDLSPQRIGELLIKKPNFQSFNLD